MSVQANLSSTWTFRNREDLFAAKMIRGAAQAMSALFIIICFNPFEALLKPYTAQCYSVVFVLSFIESLSMITNNSLSFEKKIPTICIGENKGADKLRSNC